MSYPGVRLTAQVLWILDFGVLVRHGLGDGGWTESAKSRNYPKTHFRAQFIFVI